MIPNVFSEVIGLEKRVIDLSRFEIRPRITEADLERQYDEFVERVAVIGYHFEDSAAFRQASDEVAREKRPKLLARKPKLPWLFNRHYFRMYELDPSKRTYYSDKYFVSPHCIIKIAGKTKEADREGPESDEFENGLEAKLARYPGYDGIIEIPSDYTLSKTKGSLFHESLHYLIARYQSSTGRRFTDNLDVEEGEKDATEQLANEAAVEILTDEMLATDHDALFENRSLHHVLAKPMHEHGIHFVAGIAFVGIAITVTTLNAAYLLPLALVPGRLVPYLKRKYRESKKEELLKEPPKCLQVKI